MRNCIRAESPYCRPYNSGTMLRRLTAVLIFHFLLCVGISAVGLTSSFSAPQWTQVAEQSAHSDSSTSGAISDTSEHALMDDKGELPDQLEAVAPPSISAPEPMTAVPLLAVRSPSAVDSPPHRPPKELSLFV